MTKKYPNILLDLKYFYSTFHMINVSNKFTSKHYKYRNSDHFSNFLRNIKRINLPLSTYSNIIFSAEENSSSRIVKIYPILKTPY